MSRAHAIETRLEKLLPALDEYYTSGFLTRSETVEVARQRTHWEYRLVARPLLLLDVRDAIAYELALEERLRAYCVRTKLTLRHRWSILERVERIYHIGLKNLRDADEREAVRREAVQFMRHYQRHASLSKLYATLMVRYPTRHELWVEAAEWECVARNNVDGARAIVQTALLTMSSQAAVWACALRVELHFVARLLRRIVRDARNADTAATVATSAHDGDNDEEENDDDDHTVTRRQQQHEEEEAEGMRASTSRGQAALSLLRGVCEENASMAEVLCDVALAKTVVEEALRSPASGLALARALLRVACEYAFAADVVHAVLDGAVGAMLRAVTSNTSAAADATTTATTAATSTRQRVCAQWRVADGDNNNNKYTATATNNVDDTAAGFVCTNYLAVDALLLLQRLPLSAAVSSSLSLSPRQCDGPHARRPLCDVTTYVQRAVDDDDGDDDGDEDDEGAAAATRKGDKGKHTTRHARRRVALTVTPAQERDAALCGVAAALTLASLPRTQLQTLVQLWPSLMTHAVPCVVAALLPRIAQDAPAAVSSLCATLLRSSSNDVTRGVQATTATAAAADENSDSGTLQPTVSTRPSKRRGKRTSTHVAHAVDAVTAFVQSVCAEVQSSSGDEARTTTTTAATAAAAAAQQLVSTAQARVHALVERVMTSMTTTHAATAAAAVRVPWSASTLAPLLLRGDCDALMQTATATATAATTTTRAANVSATATADDDTSCTAAAALDGEAIARFIVWWKRTAAGGEDGDGARRRRALLQLLQQHGLVAHDVAATSATRTTQGHTRSSTSSNGSSSSRRRDDGDDEDVATQLRRVLLQQPTTALTYADAVHTPLELWRLLNTLEVAEGSDALRRARQHDDVDDETAAAASRQQPSDSDSDSDSDSEQTTYTNASSRGQRQQHTPCTTATTWPSSPLRSFAAAGLRFLATTPYATLDTPAAYEWVAGVCALLRSRVYTLTGITRPSRAALLSYMHAASPSSSSLPSLSATTATTAMATMRRNIAELQQLCLHDAARCQPFPRYAYVHTVLPLLEAVALYEQQRTSASSSSSLSSSAAAAAALCAVRAVYERLLRMYSATLQLHLCVPLVYNGQLHTHSDEDDSNNNNNMAASRKRTRSSNNKGGADVAVIAPAEANARDWAAFVWFERHIAADLQRAHAVAARAQRSALDPQRLLTLLAQLG